RPLFRSVATALATQDAGHAGPLAHLSAQILRPAPEPLDGRGRIGVAARRLEGGGAEVLDVREGLEVMELVGRERHGVDPDGAEHLDVAAERVGVLRGHDVYETRVRAHGARA